MVVLSFAAGAALGVLLQAYYGAGRALRYVGIIPPLPTVVPRPTPTAIPPGVDEALQGRLALFILAGQSNMSGRAELPDDQALDPQIVVFGNDYRWRVAVEPIDSPQGQVDAVSADMADDLARFSPGVAFARARPLSPDNAYPVPLRSVSDVPEFFDMVAMDLPP